MKQLVCLVLLVLATAACMPAPGTEASTEVAPWTGTREGTGVARSTRTGDSADAVPATITVYFLDENMFAVGTEPYEKGVTRTIPTAKNLARAVLNQLFLGPTAEEQAQGLALVLSGSTGYSDFRLDDEGVAHITLTGECNSGGSTYTIANLIFANLAQFPRIKWIKIYDQDGGTETPDGQSNSIPFCLEP